MYQTRGLVVRTKPSERHLAASTANSAFSLMVEQMVGLLQATVVRSPIDYDVLLG